MNGPLLETAKILLCCIVIILFISVNTLFLVWMERKVAGRIQRRPGPLHVGPMGLLQTVADAIKLLSKELVMPAEANKFLYLLAPVLVFAPLLSAFLVVPVAQGAILRDLNIGFLLIFALANISFIGIFVAGWSSNSKYALLGSMRAVAQNISYEIPLLLSTMGVVLASGTLRTTEIVSAQEKGWFLFTLPMGTGLLGFMLFFCSSLAEANRAPFDIPEAESELVAGFHTEYSGIRFALFFLGEYTAVFVSAMIASTLSSAAGAGRFCRDPSGF